MEACGEIVGEMKRYEEEEVYKIGSAAIEAQNSDSILNPSF